jgi:hypothetical protein
MDTSPADDLMRVNMAATQPHRQAWLTGRLLTPTAKGLEIELVGEIAKMMKLSGGPESLEEEPYLSSVKLVAGRGFEPLTFRL